MLTLPRKDWVAVCAAIKIVKNVYKAHPELFEAQRPIVPSFWTKLDESLEQIEMRTQES